jgi:hypothetical protein
LDETKASTDLGWTRLGDSSTSGTPAASTDAQWTIAGDMAGASPAFIVCFER